MADPWPCACGVLCKCLEEESQTQQSGFHSPDGSTLPGMPMGCCWEWWDAVLCQEKGWTASWKGWTLSWKWWTPSSLPPPQLLAPVCPDSRSVPDSTSVLQHSLVLRSTLSNDVLLRCETQSNFKY